MMRTKHSLLLISVAAYFATVAFASEVDFDYRSDSERGPQNWATLDIDHNECGGESNSPINVPAMECTDFLDYTLVSGDCTLADMNFVVNDHAVQANYNNSLCVPNTLKIPGMDATYEALQFHIHTSSEHTINGEFFGAELHVVHLDRAANPPRYAVVGMMIMPDSPTDNEMFEAILKKWVKMYQEEMELCGTPASHHAMEDFLSDLFDRNTVFDIYSLLPEGTGFYHYDGGLTTPPCSEVVWWNLASQVVNISPRQFNHLAQVILSYQEFPECHAISVASASGSTSRPTQPLNGRRVQLLCPTTP